MGTGLSPFRTGLVDLNRFWCDVLPPTAGWQFDLRRAGFRTFTTGKVDSNYKPMSDEYKRILFHEKPAARDAGKRNDVKKYLDKGPDIAGVGHPNDDGFNLGTHDSFRKMSQWDSAAHVPLGLWNAWIKEPKVIERPISLHNIPKRIMDLAGLPYRPDWISGQSLLPLIDDSFGQFNETKSPVTSVFGTLSIQPATGELNRYRYFRYPNGEERVYDMLIAKSGRGQDYVLDLTKWPEAAQISTAKMIVWMLSLGFLLYAFMETCMRTSCVSR